MLSRASSSTESSKQTSLTQPKKMILFRPKSIPARLMQQAQLQQSSDGNSLNQDVESLQLNAMATDANGSTPNARANNKYNNIINSCTQNSNSNNSGPKSPETKSNNRPKSFALDKQLILEFKGRPRDEPRPQRPRSLARDSKAIMEFKGRPLEAADAPSKTELTSLKLNSGILEFKLRNNRRKPGYSSTESMATSSSGGSMESIRSSTSEGNRSTSSSESRRSSSLSSHSSDSGSANCLHNNQRNQQQQSLLNHQHHHNHHQSNKLHILSPISDKSAQEQQQAFSSETQENNRNNNSPDTESVKSSNTIINVLSNSTNTTNSPNNATTPTDSSFKKSRRAPQNKNLINLALQSSSSGDAEIQGSDSGISIESRASIKCKPTGFHPTKPQAVDNLNATNNEQDFSDLPFDMPKLRRRRLLMQQDAATSGSSTSVDLKDLPFDMPKLRRRLRCTQSVDLSNLPNSSSLSGKDAEETEKSYGKCSNFNLLYECSLVYFLISRI